MKNSFGAEIPLGNVALISNIFSLVSLTLNTAATLKLFNETNWSMYIVFLLATILGRLQVSVTYLSMSILQS